jgi:hypothetical protein
VVDGETGRLRALASRGLSPEEVSACEEGRSVPGVSSSRIREALVDRVPVMVQDAEHLPGSMATTALRGRPSSVRCAPVCDPRTPEVLAVLYVQNYGMGGRPRERLTAGPRCSAPLICFHQAPVLPGPSSSGIPNMPLARHVKPREGRV